MALMDTSKHKTASFSPVPVGRYSLKVNEAEWKKTQSGGKMLALELSISKGKGKGRKVWENINLEHDNPEVVEIAKKTASALVLSAVGEDVVVKDVPHLIKLIKGKTVTAQLKITPATKQYAAKNEVHYFTHDVAAEDADGGDKKKKKKKKKNKKPW